MSAVLIFIFNCFITLFLLYGFNIIGQIANNKYFNSRFKYALPIGFGWFILTFQVIAYPFILVQARFSIFLLLVIIFFMLWIIYILINNKYFNWKINLKSNYGIYCIIGFVFIFLAVKSYIYSDSWLYSSMISSTIHNNLIYSNDGRLADVKLSIMHHRFESYYLWQAVVALGYGGKYLVALTTEYKLFDAALLVFSFAELGHQFKFGKYKSILFATTMFLMLTSKGTFLDISPFQATEPPVQFLQISTGTALFYTFIMPMSLIYLRCETKFSYKQKNIFLLGLLVAYSSLSTTFYYTYPLYIIVLLTIKHLIYNQHDKQLVLAFMGCWMLIINSYIGVLTNSISYSLIFMLIYLALTKLVLTVYNTMTIKFLKISTYVIYGLYLVIGILVFNPLIFSTSDFTTDKQALRISNIVVNFGNGSYMKIVLPVLFLMFICFILISLVRNKQFNKITEYILIYCLLFLNPIATTLYIVLGVQPVTSRIYSFSFIGYIIVIYAFYNSKYLLNKIMLLIWIVVAYMQLILPTGSEFDTKMAQVNAINSNIDGLASYDYEPSSFIVFDNLNATYGSEVYLTGINKLITLNPSLSWDPKIYSCEQLFDENLYPNKFDNCYTIYDKGKAEDLNYIYETDKYLVYKNY